jgi:hypothetical protein
MTNFPAQWWRQCLPNLVNVALHQIDNSGGHCLIQPHTIIFSPCSIVDTSLFWLFEKILGSRILKYAHYLPKPSAAFFGSRHWVHYKQFYCQEFVNIIVTDILEHVYGHSDQFSGPHYGCKEQKRQNGAYFHSSSYQARIFHLKISKSVLIHQLYFIHCLLGYFLDVMRCKLDFAFEMTSSRKGNWSWCGFCPVKPAALMQTSTSLPLLI